MLDLNNLSKIKYIYRIYESSDGILQCEKFPVIYINSEVVYFKEARKNEMLRCLRISSVTDNLTTFYNNISYYRYFDKYFWNVENNIQEIYKELKKKNLETQIKNKKENATNNL